jgi:hypothetical protein
MDAAKFKEEVAMIADRLQTEATYLQAMPDWKQSDICLKKYGHGDLVAITLKRCCSLLNELLARAA